MLASLLSTNPEEVRSKAPRLVPHAASIKAKPFQAVQVIISNKENISSNRNRLPKRCSAFILTYVSCFVTGQPLISFDTNKKVTQ
jgi:hypothetical protein